MSVQSRSLFADKCCVCDNRLDLFGFRPHLLQCSHSSCERCVELKESEPIKVVFCKTCNEDIDCSVTKLDIFWIKNSLESERKGGIRCKRDVRATCVSCKKRLVVEVYCRNCKGPLCSDCANVHRNLEALETHTFDEKNEERERAYELCRSVMLCSVHEKEEKHHYCEDCGVCLCNICKKESHNDHRTLSFKNDATVLQEIMKSQCNQWCQQISFKKSLLNSRIDNGNSGELFELCSLKVKLKEWFESTFKNVVNSTCKGINKVAKQSFQPSDVFVKDFISRLLRQNFVSGFFAYKEFIESEIFHGGEVIDIEVESTETERVLALLDDFGNRFIQFLDRLKNEVSVRKHQRVYQIVNVEPKKKFSDVVVEVTPFSPQILAETVFTSTPSGDRLLNSCKLSAVANRKNQALPSVSSSSTPHMSNTDHSFLSHKSPDFDFDSFLFQPEIHLERIEIKSLPENVSVTSQVMACDERKCVEDEINALVCSSIQCVLCAQHYTIREIGSIEKRDDWNCDFCNTTSRDSSVSSAAPMEFTIE